MKHIDFLAFLLLGFFGVLIGSLTYLLISSQVDPNVKVGVLAALGAVLATLLTHWFTKKREIEARHFDKKRQSYEAIMNTFSQLFTADKLGKKITPHQLLKAVIKHRLDIAVWADKDLIEWWLKLSNQPEVGMPNEEALRMGESLIRAIRKELGKDDSEIETGHLIALFLRESPEEVIKQMGS